MRHTSFSVAALLALLFYPAQLAAQAPDCSRLPTPAERAVCMDERLSQLDTRVRDLYQALRTKLDADSRLNLARDQSEWQGSRNDCGARTTCLSTSYSERIAQLQRRLEAVTPGNAPSIAKSPRNDGPPVSRCEGENDIASLNSRIATTISFRNNAPTGATSYRIYWLDYAGNRQHRATLLRGQSHTQKTYLTHPWVVTRSDADGEKCLRIVMPDPVSRTITLR
ncbi:MAG: hypothetical protein RLZ98_2324 [Pseudomonadota bacterium]|jgi:uncharacterized protein